MADAPKLASALDALIRDRHDEAAWRTVYGELSPRARVIAYRLLGGDEAAALDVTHDAFLRLLKYADFATFRSAEDLTRYFHKIVKNCCLATLRSRSNQVRSSSSSGISASSDLASEEDLGSSETAADPSQDVESYAIAGGAVALLEQNLSREDRFVVELLAQGYGSGEIALRLGTTEANAAVRIHRLRNRIRQLIQPPER